jgi:glycosyltransferase involved in cell wall biosynthesis
MPDALFFHPARPLRRGEGAGTPLAGGIAISPPRPRAARRRLRLLLLSDAENLIVRRHAAWFAARDFDVHLLHCPMQARAFEAAGPIPEVSIHRGLARPGARSAAATLAQVWRLRRVIRGLRPDCLHLMSPRVSAQVAARLTRGTAKIFSPWGADILDDAEASRWQGLRARTLLRDFDSMVAASVAMAKRARSFAKTDRELIIPWGVETRVFHPHRDTEQLRHRLELQPGQRVIASPRQLGTKYQHEVVLRAFARLAPERPELILVMKYAIAQGDLAKRIPALVCELGLQNRVRILGPSPTPETSHRVMADLLALADVAVSVPSWDGGTPATLFEALASEAALVLSDIDTNREFLTPDREARFCRPGDPEDLARALAAALDPNWRREAIHRGREIARTCASRDEHLTRLADHYRSLAEQVSA